jgi:ADP-ribosylglycohydrolase
MVSVTTMSTASVPRLGGTRSAGRLDRAAGVLLGAACGDALGVPYEFQPPLAVTETPRMIGGGLGPYEPAEYSDDTQMAVCIAQVAASGADLRDEAVLDAIAGNFLDWADRGATDIGAQTRAVLSAAREDRRARPAAALRAAAAGLHQRTGRSAGNGSLMRTAVVALPYLDDPEAMAQAARAVSDLTHPDPLAGDACVLWCAAIRRAVLDGTFGGPREGLELLPAAHRGRWAGWIAEAEAREPGTFTPNGFVVPALQAAWSAVSRTYVLIQGAFDCAAGREHIDLSLEAAIRAGDDTDTVAAIAGALLGARWGAGILLSSGLAPRVHGWPGLGATDLVRLSMAALLVSGSHAHMAVRNSGL